MSVDMSVWSGRVDAGEGDLARRWHQLARPYAAGLEPGVGIIGFVSDEGVRRNQGRVGAAAGPAAIRKALANLAWHQPLPLCDAGDVDCADGDLDAAHIRLGERVRQLRADGHFPLVLGGGHETAYGTWRGLAAAHPDKVIGIVNFDAHFDIREALKPPPAPRSPKSPPTARRPAAPSITCVWAWPSRPIPRRCSPAPARSASSGRWTAT